MDGMTPERGDYVEVLVDGESKSGGNIRARTPKGDIQIPGGEEGEVVVVKIYDDNPPFRAEIVEPPEDETIHSLVEYHRNLRNPTDPETSDRGEKWIRERTGGTDEEEVRNPHYVDRKGSEEDEEADDESGQESPFSDDVAGSKNDLL